MVCMLILKNQWMLNEIYLPYIPMYSDHLKFQTAYFLVLEIFAVLRDARQRHYDSFYNLYQQKKQIIYSEMLPKINIVLFWWKKSNIVYVEVNFKWKLNNLYNLYEHFWYVMYLHNKVFLLLLYTEIYSATV